MEIKIDEFYKRLATEVMMSMSDVYYDDLIGYRWQIPESDFFNDIVGYVSVDDWDEKNVKEIEKEISKGLSALHEFMGGFYVCNYEDEDGEGHITIKGTYPDDQYAQYYDDSDYPETDFDAYDISSAIRELCSEFYITLYGTFTIIEGEVSTTYDEHGDVVKDN